MRAIGLGIMLAGLLMSCGKGKEGVTITVEYDGQVPPGGHMVLYELKLEGLIPIDTLDNVKESTFETTIKPASEAFYRLDAFRSQFVNLILSSEDDEVEITIKGSKKVITGSKKSLTVLSIDELLERAKRDAEQLNNEAMAANEQGDQVTLQAIIAQFEDQRMKQIVDLKSIVTEASPSLVAMYGLNFIDMQSEFKFYDSMVSATLVVYPDHFWPLEVKKELDKIRMLSIGQPAPDFTLNTPEGKPVSLSDLKGKYVLIDFWAAWCRPCREENPNVVRAYKKYGGDQFEILGVSLDRTKEAWVKAITDDGLPWVHVSDLQYYNSAAAQLYNIHAIPATYLIDPSGRILAKNLRGASLDAKLNEIFGE